MLQEPHKLSFTVSLTRKSVAEIRLSALVDYCKKVRLPMREHMTIILTKDLYRTLNADAHVLCNCNLKRYMKKHSIKHFTIMIPDI